MTKNHTREKVEAHLRISFGHLLMNLKNKEKNYFNIYKFHFLKKIMKNTCGYHYQNLNDMYSS